jgi:hypothetical protein
MNTQAGWLPKSEGVPWRQRLWKIQKLWDFINKLLGLVNSKFKFIVYYGIVTFIGVLSLIMVWYPPYRFITEINHGTILISYHLFMMFIAGLLGLRMAYVSKKS